MTNGSKIRSLWVLRMALAACFLDGRLFRRAEAKIATRLSHFLRCKRLQREFATSATGLKADMCVGWRKLTSSRVCCIRPGCSEGTVSVPVKTMPANDRSNDSCCKAEYHLPRVQTQHGSSLRPLLETESATRDFALNEWGLLPGRVGVALELRTVRTHTHKMTIDLNSGAGELYDLVTDPFEKTNLFDAPEAAAIRKQLEAHIATRPDDQRPDGTPVGTA